MCVCVCVCDEGKEKESHSVEVREAVLSRDGYSFMATGIYIYIDSGSIGTAANLN